MPSLDRDAVSQLFLQARTYTAWQPRPVSDELLREVHALASIGPTASNCQPGRFVFVRSPEAKARLVSTLNPGNVPKVQAAPVTVIVAMDSEFYEFMPELWPHAPDARDNFANNATLAQSTAFRNSSLQGAYLIMAARAVGLDCGPMSGFNADKVNAEFFADGRWRANFICNLGYGDASALRPRQKRLPFDVACRLE
jgi:3-hydroxypropanoate dehydrogenase